MSFCFPKSARLRTRRQYQRIGRQATRHVGQWIIIEVCPNRGPLARLGITAARKYGDAVCRNRFKRIVREAFRLCREQLQKAVDINIRPRNAAKDAKTCDILAELL